MRADEPAHHEECPSTAAENKTRFSDKLDHFIKKKKMKRSKCDEGRCRNQCCCSPLARESNENREWKGVGVGVGVVGICRNEVKQENPENDYKYFSVVPQSLSHSRSSEQYPPVWKNPRESVSVSNECITRLSLSPPAQSHMQHRLLLHSPQRCYCRRSFSLHPLSQYFIQICCIRFL